MGQDLNKRPLSLTGLSVEALVEASKDVNNHPYIIECFTILMHILESNNDPSIASNMVLIFESLSGSKAGADIIIAQQKEQVKGGGVIYSIIQDLNEMLKVKEASYPKIQFLINIAQRLLEKIDAGTVLCEPVDTEVFEMEKNLKLLAAITLAFTNSILNKMDPENIDTKLKLLIGDFFAIDAIPRILLSHCAFQLFSGFNLRTDDLEWELDSSRLLEDKLNEANVNKHTYACQIFFDFIHIAIKFKVLESLLHKEVAIFLTSLLKGNDPIKYVRPPYTNHERGLAILEQLIRLCEQQDCYATSKQRQEVVDFFTFLAANAYLEIRSFNIFPLILKAAALEENFAIANQFLKLLDSLDLTAKIKVAISKNIFAYSFSDFEDLAYRRLLNYYIENFKAMEAFKNFLPAEAEHMIYQNMEFFERFENFELYFSALDFFSTLLEQCHKEFPKDLFAHSRKIYENFEHYFKKFGKNSEIDEIVKNIQQLNIVQKIKSEQTATWTSVFFRPKFKKSDEVAFNL